MSKQIDNERVTELLEILADRFSQLQPRDCTALMDALLELRNLRPLAKALDECATRFERCCIHSGSDKGFAAHAVEDYRALVKAARS